MKEKTKWSQSFGKRRVARLLLATLFCAFLVEPLGGYMGNPLISTAQAAGDEAIQAADELYELGLFQGSGTNADGSPNYNLDAPLNRAEGITMMVRIMGAEEKAKAGTWETPFEDVPTWAEPYVGYAYANKYANGTGAASFGSEDRITATQYITTILRALNYSSETDFQWDQAWELSDKIGLTDGRYKEENNNDFLRADAVIVSAAALDIKLKNSDLTLRDMLFSDKEVSFDYTTRLLSDEQIKALKGKKPEELKKAISTLADARAYMDSWYKGFYTNAMNGGNGWYQIPSAETVLTGDGDIAPNTLAACITYLLSDDFEVYTIYGLRQDFVKEEEQEDFGYPVKVINCVKTPEGYTFFTPFDLEHGDLSVNSFTLLPAANTASFEEYAAMVASDKGMKDVSALYAVTDGAEIMLTIENGWFYMDEPAEKPFFAVESWQKFQDAKDQKIKKDAEAWAKLAPTLKVSSYGIPKAIGETTLTYQDAASLVGKAPVDIAKEVKTVGDVLQYMIASRFGYSANGVYTPWYSGWGYDAPGDKQLQQNYGCCCAGYANTVSYLLQGDYEKIGQLRWIGGGNHVINWLYTEGKYYVFDFTQYCRGGNYYNDPKPPVTVLDKLEDYYSQVPSIYPKNEMVIVVAYETGGKGGYPSQWTDPPYFTGLTLPKEAEGSVIVIYQKDKQNGVIYQEIDITIPGWND